MRSLSVNWPSKVVDWLRYGLTVFTLGRATWLRAERKRVDNIKDLRPEQRFLSFLPRKSKNLSGLCHKRLRNVMEMVTMMTATLILRTKMVGPKQEATRA